MKLLSMIDFVLGIENYRPKNQGRWNSARLRRIQKYAKFLKQDLTLGMFIPCDEDGNPLEEPIRDLFLTNGICRTDDFTKAIESYKKAKEKVLFQGLEIKKRKSRICFYVHDYFFINSYDLDKKEFALKKGSIDTLTPLGLLLTESAIKQLEL